MGNEPVESFDKDTKFLVCGYVKRRWVSESGKYGTITIEDCGDRQPIVNVQCFADGPIAEIRKLEPGMLIKVSGKIGTQAIKDKKGEEIKIDGYRRYENTLTVKRIAVSPTSRKSSDENGGGSNDELPAGW